METTGKRDSRCLGPILAALCSMVASLFSCAITMLLRGPVMNFDNQNRNCHAERSEASRRLARQMLSAAKHDKTVLARYISTSAMGAMNRHLQTT
jgi:hypothetical protein